MRSQNISYIERLDHLRFFAAFIVLMYHAFIFYPQKNPVRFPILDQGYVGVTLFMVLSGFLLTLISFNRELIISRFYVNRILRIYPLFIFIVTLGYFSTPEPREISAGIAYLLSLLPISNLYRMNYGPFGGQLWSVMVEIQFYLLFPVLALTMKRVRLGFYLSVISILVVVRCAVYLLNSTVYDLAYFSLFGNLDCFLIGCAVAVLYIRNEAQTFPWYVYVLIFGAINAGIVVLYRFLGLSATSPLWIIWPDIQGLMWSALIFTYLRADMTVPLSRQWAYLGKISYSIYAWHILVWMIVARSMPAPLISPYLTGLVLVLPATLALAALSYAVIEAPFLRMRTRYIVGASAPVDLPAPGASQAN